ncbi:subunit RSC8 of RSC chromatin remodeling complex [Sesbania bispinosa]|nr:subunit RSC8 of RSC chromatin remodeling complex [Sesbania bispinosa]
MLKGGRSGQEKNHSIMKSPSSSSSHPRRMVCKCGEEVLLLKSSTFTVVFFYRVAIVATSFVGVMKKTWSNLEMMRLRDGMSERLQIWNSKYQN